MVWCEIHALSLVRSNLIQLAPKRTQTNIKSGLSWFYFLSFFAVSFLLIPCSNYYAIPIQKQQHIQDMLATMMPFWYILLTCNEWDREKIRKKIPNVSFAAGLLLYIVSYISSSVDFGGSSTGRNTKRAEHNLLAVFPNHHSFMHIVFYFSCSLYEWPLYVWFSCLAHRVILRCITELSLNV